MEGCWIDPVGRFWDRLYNGVVDRMINDPKKVLLRHMRHDYGMVRDYQKRFGYIFRERGLNLFELIARACGEIWDEEDEEKGGVLKKLVPMELKGTQQHAVCVDYPCQVGVRERQIQGDDVQAGNDQCKIQLQEGECCKVGGGSQEKTAEKKKQKSEGGGVSEHTKGLGNVEEGRLAEGKKPKKKRQRKRPSLGQTYKIQN
mgnify:CR=1 FL=1